LGIIGAARRFPGHPSGAAWRRRRDITGPLHAYAPLRIAQSPVVMVVVDLPYHAVDPRLRVERGAVHG